jgi:hypothetical protein
VQINLRPGPGENRDDIISSVSSVTYANEGSSVPLLRYSAHGVRMSLEIIERVFPRASIAAYSRHPVAQLHRAWRRVAGRKEDGGLVGVLPLPLAGLAISLLLLSTPGASDAIAAACALACLP